MSNQVDQAFVDAFTSNVIMLSQQKGSRLGGLLRREDYTGERKAFERVGATSAVKRTSRHADTPQVDTPHDRRWATTETWDWADLIDKRDQIRMLIEPTSIYARAGALALGRTLDDVVISAFDGTVYEGHKGTTASTFPSAQEIAVDAVEPGGAAANSNLTIEKLIQAKSLFGQNDVDPDDPLIFVCTQSQLDAMLRKTEVRSADYNSVRALVEGRVDTFMGFTFVRTQRLKTDANGYRKCFALTVGDMGAMGLCINQEPDVKISERADKNYSTQVWMSMDVGAARIEDEKIVRVLCDETA